MYISFGKLACQCPVAFAATTMPRKRQAMTAATASGESARRRHLSAGVAAFLGTNENCRAPSAGYRRHTPCTPFNLHELINGKAGRASARAFSAIDTCLDVASDLYRAEQRCDSEQRTVRTEISAPEVLDQHGQKNQQTDDDCRCLPDIAKEIQHLDIRQPSRKA
jgi:hypothetical protein